MIDATCGKETGEKQHALIQMLPDCHTIEGEAFGADIRYEEGKGYRGGSSVVSSFAQFLQLPPIQLETDRIQELSVRCKALKEQGETVCVKVSGPLTILNLLGDGSMCLKAFRKQKEEMERVLLFLREQLLRYTMLWVEQGVDMISFGDPIAGYDILGPKAFAMYADAFLVPYIREMKALLGEKQMLLLCPKLSKGLERIGRLEYRKRHMKHKETYVEACIEMMGTVKLAGQCCMNRNPAIESCFLELDIKEKC